MEGRMISTTAFTLDRTTIAGAVCGIVAAVVMIMIATIIAAVQGADPFAPVILIGATFVGEDALTQPMMSSLVGVVTHVAMGAALGYLFGALTRRIASTGLLVATGLAYATVVFLVMTYLVLPFLNPLMAAQIQPGWFFVYHLAFGLVLPASLAVARTHPTRRWFGDRVSRSSAW